VNKGGTILIEQKHEATRDVIALAAIIMQISLGAVYGYSVLTTPIMQVGGWSATLVAAMFESAILFLGLGSLLGGLWQDRVGPRKVAVTGGILYGLGYVIAAYGVTARSILVIILGYGVIGGLGNGFAYITPVATLVKWFPDKRGVVTGLAVAGFGVGAMIMTQFVGYWMPHYGVASTLLWMGLGYGVIVTLGALTFTSPPKGWRPAGWHPGEGGAKAVGRNYSAAEALRTPQYWMLWLMLFLNVCAGIMIISTLKPLAVETVGMSAAAAVALVGFMGLFNGGGRLLWAWVSDRIGRPHVFLIMYLMQAVLFGLLLLTTNVAMFAAITALIYLCYGGGFGTMPSFVADYFGPEYVGSIYGSILLAWGIGGVVGPLLITVTRQAFGSYSPAIAILAVVMLIAAVLPLRIKPPENRRPVGS
jgi:OFA family oxalate/formate antiporter-like MFS transporter